MRILCVMTEMGSGGAERQMTGLAGMLAAEGREVRVCWFGGNDFYVPELDSAGISHKLLPARSKALRMLKLAFEILRFRPSTVVAFLDGAAAAACRVRRFFPFLRFRLVVSERNVTQAITPAEKKKFALYAYADAIVCNSRTQGTLVCSAFPRLAPKTEVITNFVDLEKYRPAQSPGDSCVDSSGGAESPLRLAVVARTSPQKNPERFMRAMEIVAESGADVSVDWYGARGEWLERSTPQVAFHPATKDLPEVYAECDALCLPSLYEGFPNVVCEALACGLPVLCSDVCDNPTLVWDGVNGFLFDPLEPEEIAGAILRFCRLDASSRTRMGQVSRERAEALLSPGTFLASWKDVL